MKVNSRLEVRGDPTFHVGAPLRRSPTLCHKGSGQVTSLHEALDTGPG